MRTEAHITIEPNIRRIVFTDLDGTLLDHHSYDWQPAAATLEALKTRGIPVVLVSSKTLAEIALYRGAMALPDPVVGENGATACKPTTSNSGY